MSLTLTDLLTDVLGFTEDERVSIGGENATNPWRIMGVVPPSEAQALIDQYATGWNAYYGVNPVRKGIAKGKRGEIPDVTRLACLWADLDVKPGNGVGSMAEAREIIARLSEWMGTQPSAITRSGHGLHPIWPVEGGEITDAEDRARVLAVLARWKEAVRRAGAGVESCPDSVFDPTRMLRAPGTENVKNPSEPVAAVTEPAPGAPLTLSEIEERLDELGIAAPTEPGTAGGVVLSKPEDWSYAETTCEYAEKLIAGWAKDVAKDGRHQWLLSQATRVSCLIRYGCLSEDGHRRAVQVLDKRFRQLCSEGIGGKPREVKPPTATSPGEVAAELLWGERKTMCKTNTEVAKELGDHPHALPIKDMLATLAGQLNDDDVVAGFDDRALEAQALADGSGDETGDDDAGAAGSAQAAGMALNGDTMTDSGMADAVALAYAPRLRYCPELSRWLMRTGSLWEIRSGDAEIYQATRRVVDVIPRDDRLESFRRRMLSSKAINGVVSLAKRAAPLQVRVDQMDADPYALNTGRGVIDLRTGETVGRDGMIHTKATGCGVLMGGEHKLFDAFMNNTFGGDTEMIAFLQRLFGLTAIGEVLEHLLPFFNGSGRNGKGVLLELMQLVMGSYAITAPLGFLMARRGDKHETEIARLHGARMVICSEVNRGDRFDEAKVKALSGPDGKLTGRYMGSNFFDFTPSHTLYLTGNEEPEVTAGGPSFWDRLLKILFENYVPPEKRIAGLARLIFDTEGPAVLGWVVQGALDYQRFGLVPPPKVKAATAEYAASQDPIGRFVDDCLVVGLSDDQKVSTRLLNAVYRGWCREVGEDPVTENALGRALGNRYGLGKARDRNGWYRTGVALTAGAKTYVVGVGVDE